MVRSLAALVCMIMYHRTRYWIAPDAFIRKSASVKEACWIKWFHCSNRVLSTYLSLLAYLSIKMSTTTTMTLSLTSIRMEELQQQNHSVHLLWSRKLLKLDMLTWPFEGIDSLLEPASRGLRKNYSFFFCWFFFFIYHWFHFFSPRGCHLDQTHFFLPTIQSHLIDNCACALIWQTGDSVWAPGTCRVIAAGPWAFKYIKSFLLVFFFIKYEITSTILKF